MGHGCIQVLLFIERESQCATKSASSAKGVCLPKRNFALLPSQARNYFLRKILKKNSIKVLQRAHVNSPRHVKLEIVEVFVEKEHNRPHLHVSDTNYGFVQQLFGKTENVIIRRSFTAARHVLGEKENLQVVEKMLATGTKIRHSNGGTLLHYAAGSGHFYKKLIELALRYGANINARRGDGMAPLHLAVEANCFDSVRFLLEIGALISTTTKDGSKPLHVAARKKRLKIARLLLDKGVNANAIMKDGSTPCHEAAKACSPDIVRLLLGRGANADAKMKNLSTPLHRVLEAGLVGRLEIVERLVQSGADINAKTEDGATPLHMAARHVDNKDRSILFYLLTNGADINAETNSNETVLSEAVCAGKFATCNHLLGLNPDFSVKGSRTAFKVALGRFEPESQEIIKRMVQQGFSVDASDAKDPEFLFGAIYKQRREIVEQLLILGANVNQHGEFKGRMVTPLHLAIQEHQHLVDIVQLLLDHGANVSVRADPNDYESTPIFHAVTFARPNIVKMLVAKYVKVVEEVFLLHSAVKTANLEIIQSLLEGGAVVNVKNENGKTPMSIAVNKGNINAIDVLARFGAKVSLMDICPPMVKDPVHLTAFLDLCFEYHILAADAVSKLFGSEYRWSDYFRAFIAKHLVKMEMANKLACARDVLPRDLYEKLKLDDFKKQCEIETETMALEKVGHSDVTFYDVLGKSLAQIAGLARNQNFVETFKMCDVKEKFPIYGSILDSKFCLGSLRGDLLKRGMKVLSYLSRLFHALPDDVKEIIVDYLSNQDLFILQKDVPKE